MHCRQERADVLALGALDQASPNLKVTVTHGETHFWENENSGVKLQDFPQGDWNVRTYIKITRCSTKRVTSFQSCSPYSGGFTGGAGVPLLRMAAMEEVSTTRLTLALDLMTALITFSVPWRAGTAMRVSEAKAQVGHSC